jgi:hypothetical protein
LSDRKLTESNPFSTPKRETIGYAIAFWEAKQQRLGEYWHSSKLGSVQVQDPEIPLRIYELASPSATILTGLMPSLDAYRLSALKFKDCYRVRIQIQPVMTVNQPLLPLINYHDQHRLTVLSNTESAPSDSSRIESPYPQLDRVPNLASGEQSRRTQEKHRVYIDKFLIILYPLLGFYEESSVDG